MIKDYGESEQKKLFFPHHFCCITALTWDFKKASQCNGAIPSTSYSISLKNSPYDFPLSSVNSILPVLDWAEMITSLLWDTSGLLFLLAWWS